MSNKKPWILDTADLYNMIGDKKLRIVDMTSKQEYDKSHIPNAAFLDYSEIVRHKPPVFGMLPTAADFSQTISKLGITADTHVVAYDDEGGGKAARFLWTLEVAGHNKMSLLNGGIHAWRSESLPEDTATPTFAPNLYTISFDDQTAIADAEYILAHLKQSEFCILDTRSKNEFNGTDKRSSRAGHIPGAVNLDWLDLKNAENAQKLKSPEELENLLASVGLYPEQEVITHCHSHHRSALMYVTLKSLGYKNVKGYPASWSDWAEREDTPVEI